MQAGALLDGFIGVLGVDVRVLLTDVCCWCSGGHIPVNMFRRSPWILVRTTGSPKNIFSGIQFQDSDSGAV